MKSNRFIVHTLTFSAGVMIGVVILGFLWFANSCASGDSAASDPKAFTLQEARDLYHNCLARNPRILVNDTLKCYAIDKEQYRAMQCLIRDNPDLAGFRIYRGYTRDLKEVGIVLGINADSTDATTLKIYSTGWGIGGPCPPLCDRNSGMN